MLRFNQRKQIYRLYLLLISIHLMLRFNPLTSTENKVGTKISIHLMLRFNSGFFVARKRICKISIHLMLRFNPLWLYILLFSSYQKSTEVTIFSIIFCHDKRCLRKNKKITRRTLTHFVL